MRIRISQPGIYGADGEIPVGTEFDVKEAPEGWAGRYDVISGGKGDDKKEPVTNPAQYTAKHKGGGNWAIVDGDGKEVADKLSKDDAELFNDASDEDKAAYVKSKTAG